MRSNGNGKRVGPTITDTLYTQKFVKFLNLKENKGLASWLCGKIKTREGRRELRALLYVELKKK